uniref:Retrovirus-related Pol polyprotein from transposon TNT 1-94 n=1 Tax=Cajanus cajan TaxID=3821 RepID=A0A151T8B9_CAJCA|nr:Retrovirus-related Pol polyprotein from transposon TNT 1-94 [Cajanus cajan]
MGKASRLKFSTSTHSSGGVLDYVHSDLWGPSRTESHGGARYFLSIVDDFSRKVWVYFLKQKNEVFDRFKEWKVLVETQIGRNLKKLRTDNGLEFCDEKFSKFCRENGVARHKTVRGTPQKNGLVERFNRTILERVRCMLNHAGLPKSFWAEAVSSAVYCINRCPSTALEFKTPQEVWSGRKVDYSELRVFGCIAYAHIKQDKLEPRALKFIFIGYPEGVKGYRLWCLEPGYKKCLISRDVVFNEIEMANLVKPSKVEIHEKSQDQTIKIEVEFTVITEAKAATQRQQHILQQELDDEERSIQSYSLARDRERRAHKAPQRYGHADLVSFAFTVGLDLEDHDEPKSYSEAMRSKDKNSWLKAMKEEMGSLEKNQTWILVDKPKEQKIVGSKWIFKRKKGILGIEKARFKERLVARGFTQREGLDYKEIFSPVVKHNSIRMILAMVTHFDMELEQMDVRTAFLHGELDETIYMKQPDGFIKEGTENQVCLLKRSLYGLKQSPRMWYKRFDEYMEKIGF